MIPAGQDGCETGREGLRGLCCLRGGGMVMGNEVAAVIDYVDMDVTRLG